MASAWDFVSVLLGRIITGAGIGMSFVTVNQYLVEIAPVNLRGAAASFFEVRAYSPAFKRTSVFFLGKLI